MENQYKDFDPIDILMVEDNQFDAEMTIRAFRKNKINSSIFVAVDGEEALDFIFARNRFEKRDSSVFPKVVFLDLKLPKISGLEVLRTIKGNESTRRIPVVVISSSREEIDIKTAYDLGVNAYLVKPVDYEDFMSTINYAGLFWALYNETPKINPEI